MLLNSEKFESAILGNIQKSQFFTSFMNWGKPGSMHSPRPTFQNPNFESMDEL